MQAGCRRRCIAEPGLTWCCTCPSALDVDLVPRDVGVPEHDDVAGREPPAQPCCAAGGRPAVVDDRQRASRRRRRSWRSGRSSWWSLLPFTANDVRDVSSQRVQHAAVRDVAGVHDDVGDSKVGADPVQQPAGLARPEVGVGEEQHVALGHRRVGTVSSRCSWRWVLSSGRFATVTWMPSSRCRCGRGSRCSNRSTRRLVHACSRTCGRHGCRSRTRCGPRHVPQGRFHAVAQRAALPAARRSSVG